jgi:hypothetical protein
LDDGPPRFPRGSTCPAVLRYLSRRCSVSCTGLSPSMAHLPRCFHCLLTDRYKRPYNPRHSLCQRILGILVDQLSQSARSINQKGLESVNKVSAGFRLFPFRSPLLWESRLISLPSGTEMFHFPEFASQGLCIQPRDDWVLPQPGCPIRKSPDQSLLDGSPRLIAAYRVLHRLLAPRHPPIALSILTSTISPLPLCNCQRASGLCRPGGCSLYDQLPSLQPPPHHFLQTKKWWR